MGAARPAGRGLSAARQLALLRRWAPALAFSAAAPPQDQNPERFLPMPVEPFIAQASLVTELRFMGLFRLRAHTLLEAGQVDAAALLHPPQIQDPSWQRLCNLPFISQATSLVFVPDDEITQEMEKNRQASHPAWKEKMGDLGTGALGCLVLSLVVLLPLSLLLRRWLEPQVTNSILGVLVFLGLVSLLGQVSTSLALVLIYLALVPACYAFFNWVTRSQTVALVCGGIWLLYALVLSMTVILSRLKHLMGLISPLPDENAPLAAARYAGLVGAQQAPLTCYGRVWQPRGYSRWRYVLQYWFFYAFNDWRTTHGGLDDHEGDWEMIQVCLPKEPFDPPQVVYSQHHTAQAVQLQAEQPQGYSGAGSHANYPQAKRYPLSMLIAGKKGLLSVQSLLALLVNLAERLGKDLPDLASSTVKSARAEGLSGPKETLSEAARERRLALVVDRATGGLSPVAGRDVPWNLVLIDDHTDWVQFKGRWGRSVLYPPESGPGGPRFQQDGSERVAWVDPIRWAGLPR